MTQNIKASMEFIFNASTMAAFMLAVSAAVEKMNITEERLHYYTREMLCNGNSRSKFVKCGSPHLAIRWESLPAEAVEPLIGLACNLMKEKTPVHLVIDDGQERRELRFERFKESF